MSSVPFEVYLSPYSTNLYEPPLRLPGCGCSAGRDQGSAGLCAPELGPTSGIQALLLRITEQPGHTVRRHHAKVTSKGIDVLWCFLLALRIRTGVTPLCWQSYVWPTPCEKGERTIQGTDFKLRSLESVFKLLNHKADF